MSLQKQFQAYMGKSQNEDLEKVSTQSLAETKVDFGKAKLNQTFAQAFEDKEWTNYMIARFEDSPKPAHQRFFQYVKRMIQDENSGNSSKSEDKVKNVKKSDKPPVKTMMAKAVDEEEDSDWERMTEMQINQNEMESRMGRMEEALAQVISHLQQLSTQGLLIQPKAEP